MTQLTVTVLQLGLLVLLWLFVISVVGVLRRDLYGTRIVARPSSAAVAAPSPARPSATPRADTPPSGAAAVPAAPGAVGATTRPAPQDAAPAAPAPRRLVVTEGPLTGATIALDRSPVLIGRAPECTLVLADDYASSRHARLVPQDGQWRVEDLGSTNGTTLARSARGPAEPLTSATAVGVGAVIRIGRTALELQR